ncbi:MAG: ferrous iron transport protein A [Pseudomonadota bacterium]|nr:ferrous iron transport protein A [Pseudomonadota bacterium]
MELTRGSVARSARDDRTVVAGFTVPATVSAVDTATAAATATETGADSAPAAAAATPTASAAAATAAASPAQAPGAAVKLADLATGAAARVVAVRAETGSPLDLGRRLAEIGFLPGERLRIVARGFMGREPIAVRIGTGTFALRLFEAACVLVCPEQSPVR